MSFPRWFDIRLPGPEIDISKSKADKFYLFKPICLQQNNP